MIWKELPDAVPNPTNQVVFSIISNISVCLIPAWMTEEDYSYKVSPRYKAKCMAEHNGFTLITNSGNNTLLPILRQ